MSHPFVWDDNLPLPTRSSESMAQRRGLENEKKTELGVEDDTALENDAQILASGTEEQKESQGEALKRQI